MHCNVLHQGLAVWKILLLTKQHLLGARFNLNCSISRSCLRMFRKVSLVGIYASRNKQRRRPTVLENEWQPAVDRRGLLSPPKTISLSHSCLRLKSLIRMFQGARFGLVCLSEPSPGTTRYSTRPLGPASSSSAFRFLIFSGLAPGIFCQQIKTTNMHTKIFSISLPINCALYQNESACKLHLLPLSSFQVPIFFRVSGFSE